MEWKPKIIDRYIMKKFIVSFFVALILIIGVVIIFDLSEKIDDFVRNEAPLREILLDYYLNFIPFFVNMFSPLFVFITVIFFTSRMAANSEIVAILSGGISYKRMLVPYMISAGIIALLSLGLNMFVVPKANVTRLEFEAKYIKRHNDFNHSHIHYQIAPGQFVYVDQFTPWNQTAYNLTLETMEGNQLVSKLSAESAVWDSTKAGWRMRKWIIRDYTSPMSDHIRTGAQLDTVIALTIDDFYRNDKTVQKLDAGELNALIDTQKMRGDANVMYAQIEKNRRMTIPFSAFILTIMGVALTSRKKRGGIGWNIAVGLGLAFLYILFLKFSEMFVYTGVLPAWVALWMPNVVYAIIAAVLYRMAPK